MAKKKEVVPEIQKLADEVINVPVEPVACKVCGAYTTRPDLPCPIDGNVIKPDVEP